MRRDPVAYLNGGLRKTMISKISPDRSKIIIEPVITLNIGRGISA
jgi:hypothetical protein